MDSEPHYWFAAKRYGWGWGPPLSWQGWIVTLVWVLAFAVGCPVMLRHGPLALVAYTVAMTLLLVAVCLVKGEPPRWRWGDDD